MATILGDYENNIEFIIHLSDIHIRLYTRHVEYTDVFSKVYRNLREYKKDGKRCVCVITGDILHSKTDLSPEVEKVTYDFLNELSSLYPTFLIAGNHDGLLNNPDRIDSISSILYKRQLNDCFYLKNTGVYEFGNIRFFVDALFDTDTVDMTEEAVVEWREGYKNIGLYHGQIKGWKNLKGYICPTGEKYIENFSGMDYMLLGDIHLYQYMSEKKPITAYASSLISQNFNEYDLNHGYLLWDMTYDSQEYVIIQNEYRHQILEIVSETVFQTDGCNYDWGNVDSVVARYGKIKVIGNEDDIFSRQKFYELKLRLKDASLSYEMKKKVERRDDNQDGQDSDLIKNEYDIILSYIKNKCSEEYYEEFSKYILNLLKENQISCNNVQFKFKELSFSNMFGYGEKNCINLANYDKCSIGIFAPNTFGKSTIIDIISILLYDKIARYSHGGSIPKEVIHFESKQAWGKLILGFGSTEYIIEKQYTRNSNQKITLKSKLFIKENDEIKELTGEQRRKNNKFIQDMLGSFENFMFFNMYLQQKENSFREMTSLTKKKFLNSIYGYDFLENYEKHHKENLKSKEIEYKLYEDQQKKYLLTDYKKDEEMIQKELLSLKETIMQHKRDIEDYENRINTMNRQLSSTYKENIIVDNGGLSLNDIQQQIDKNISDWQKKHEMLRVLNDEFNELKYMENIVFYESDDLFDQFSKGKHLDSTYYEFQNLYQKVHENSSTGMDMIESKLKKYYSKLVDENYCEKINQDILKLFSLDMVNDVKKDYHILSQEVQTLHQNIKDTYNKMHHPFDEISQSKKDMEKQEFEQQIYDYKEQMKETIKHLELYDNYEYFQSKVNVTFYRENHSLYKDSGIYKKYSPLTSTNTFEKWLKFKNKVVLKDNMDYSVIQKQKKELEDTIDALRCQLQEYYYDKNLVLDGDKKEWEKKQRKIRQKYGKDTNHFEFSNEMISEIESLIDRTKGLLELRKKIDLLKETLDSCKDVEINKNCEVCIKNKLYQKKLQISNDWKKNLSLEKKNRKDVEEKTSQFKYNFLVQFKEDEHVSKYLDNEITISEFYSMKKKYNQTKNADMESYHHRQKILENEEKKMNYLSLMKEIQKLGEQRDSYDGKLKSILDYISNINLYNFIDYQWQHRFDFNIDVFLSSDCTHDEHFNQLRLQKQELVSMLQDLEKKIKECMDIWEKDFEYKRHVESFEKQLNLHKNYELWLKEYEKLEKQEKNKKNQKKIEELEKKKKMVYLYENKKNMLDFLKKCFDSDTWKQNPEKQFQSMVQNSRHHIEEATQYIEKYNKDKKNLEHDMEILQKIQEYKTIKSNLKSMVENLDLKRGNFLSKFEECQINQTLSEENKKNMYRIFGEIQKERELITILDKDGLPLHLLKQKMSMVENKINEMIRPFSSKNISFRISDDKNSVDFGFTNSNNVICSFISGMEAFILDICLKFCLSYFYIRPKSNIFIIDEKVSVLDKEKLSNISSLFDFLKLTCTNILIISHIDIIKDYVDTSIHIKKNKNKSSLSFH